MGKNNQNHGRSRQQRSIFFFYASLLEERPTFGLCRGTQFRSIFEPTFEVNKYMGSLDIEKCDQYLNTKNVVNT